MLVITDTSHKVVGTGALVVERKFIHNLGMVGHIEDIAVAKDQQGKKLGLRIIQALDYVAEKVGCYKVCCYIRVIGFGCTDIVSLSLIAPRPMRGFILSVGLEGRGWRWRIIMAGINRRGVCRGGV